MVRQITNVQGAVNTEKPPAPQQAAANSLEFRKILDDSIRVSTHAKGRLENRNIQLDPQRLERLNHAMDKLSQKGARESLVLMDDLALIVSVRNRTVITCMDDESMKEAVVTNIDSAVIA